MRCDARGKACVYFRIGCECEQPNRSLDRIHIICCPVGKKNLSISSCEKCEVLVRRGNRIFNITLLGEHISRRCSLMPRIPESGHVDGWIGYFFRVGLGIPCHALFTASAWSRTSTNYAAFSHGVNHRSSFCSCYTEGVKIAGRRMAQVYVFWKVVRVKRFLRTKSVGRRQLDDAEQKRVTVGDAISPPRRVRRAPRRQVIVEKNETQNERNWSA
jgi:uncharacterized protein YbaR (Trm112 family)